MDLQDTLGKKIQLIREQKQIAIEALASDCRLSKVQLEKIEKGALLPGLGTLIKVARSLGVRLGTFLDGEPIDGPVICKSVDRMASASLSTDKEEVRAHLNFTSLAPNKPERAMEPFIITIDSGKQSTLASSHEGEEFIYVLEGTIMFYYGKEQHVLNQGDSIYYDSIVEHKVTSASPNNEKATILAVVYAPY